MEYGDSTIKHPNSSTDQNNDKKGNPKAIQKIYNGNRVLIDNTK